MFDGVRSFFGNGNKKQTPEEKEIALLKKQARELQSERGMLKKNVGIFSKSDRTSTNLQLNILSKGCATFYLSVPVLLQFIDKT